MADLSVEICGVRLKNPVIAASGTFGFGREYDEIYDISVIGGISTKGQETIRHDPKWTAEALGNLLDNAVKYTPEGGTVYVSVRPWQFYIRIDITDTGIGIPAEHYNDVFKRFYRAQSSAAAEGVGLGLYLAQGLITRQKGYITLASEVGRGSTFSVFLLR